MWRRFVYNRMVSVLVQLPEHLKDDMGLKDMKAIRQRAYKIAYQEEI